MSWIEQIPNYQKLLDEKCEEFDVTHHRVIYFFFIRVFILIFHFNGTHFTLHTCFNKKLCSISIWFRLGNQIGVSCEEDRSIAVIIFSWRVVGWMRNVTILMHCDRGSFICMEKIDCLRIEITIYSKSGLTGGSVETTTAWFLMNKISNFVLSLFGFTKYLISLKWSFLMDKKFVVKFVIISFFFHLPSVTSW